MAGQFDAEARGPIAEKDSESGQLASRCGSRLNFEVARAAGHAGGHVRYEYHRSTSGRVTAG